jgi:signal transduction histidine kinase
MEEIALIKQLKDELELKNKYLSLIAHDFKGLFSNILWVLGAYEKKVITEQEFKSMLPELKQNAQINLNTINDTFDWINVQRYEGEIDVKDVNSYKLILELKTSLRESILSKNISISQVGDPNFIFKSNPVLLRFILKKLIENAIKYSYLDGEIEIESRVVDPFVHFFVKDLGTGICDSNLPITFTMNEANFIGTQGEKGGGLSLIIVNDFVKLMNGKIKIYPNRDNKGTIAELIFPLLPSEFRLKRW